jgi:glycosidase
MRRLLLIVLVGLLLVACSGSEESGISAENTPNPTATVEPTNPPSATDTPAPPTATPEPTPDPLFMGTDGMPWWNDAVFYEVFVRSFRDSNGDGVGDIQGLIEKLDYLNDGNPETSDDLGVTGLWLMPINESPSYHGYDVVNYYNVDEEYGTNEDFKQLVEEANKRGMRVIIDLVTNHTGRDHEWFQESRDPESDKRDWYVWSDEDPGYRGPENQKVWHQTADGYYYGVFWDGMPDLNYENPDTTEAMYDIARFWLEEMGADGFRLDAIKHIVENGQLQENTRGTHEWLQGFYAFYKGVNPDALSVGEAWTNTQDVLKYTGDEVDIAFQFDLAQAILNSVESGYGVQIGREQSNVVDTFPPNQYATFLTNHDQNRVMTRLGEDEGAARVAATWLLTSPGVPFIYYGEEIGMIGQKPDEDIRLPMQWTSDDGLNVGFTEGRPWRFPAADYELRSVALQNEDKASLLSHYRQLIHLRNDNAALRVGDWIPVETDSAEIFAYLRSYGDENVLVVINFGRKDIAEYTLTLPEGTLTDGVTPAMLLGSGEPVAPAINAAGGFDSYTPLPNLPSQSSTIIALE